MLMLAVVVVLLGVMGVVYVVSDVTVSDAVGAVDGRVGGKK